MKDKYDIFLSYSHRDRELAEKIAQALDKADLKVWFDRWEIRPGQRWITALEDALQSSRSVLIFIGPDGIGTWAQTEVAYGLSERLKDPTFKIIPVLGPGADPAKIPPLLSTLTYVDLREWKPETLDQIIDSIKQIGKSREVTRSAPRIFLCHAKEDKRRVDELYFMLKDEGFDPWYDKENLIVGDRWQEEIFQAIEQSDFFAIFLSRKAAKKTGFIQKEIRTAAREFQRRPQDIAYLLPVRLEDCDVPLVRLDENTILADLQWIDIFEGDRDAVRYLSKGVWKQWKRRQSSS